MSSEEKQRRLLELHAAVSAAADELEVNGDQYAAIARLAEALEGVLIYLEQDQ